MALGSTALAVMAGVTAAVSAAGSISQGQAAASTGRARSDLLRQQADRERKQAEADADEFRRRQSRLLATQRAGFGASGVAFEGTPLLVGADTAGEIELQAQKILAGGLSEASALETEANFARTSGRQASTAGFVGAGASLLSGAARSASFFEEDRPRVPG